MRPNFAALLLLLPALAAADETRHEFGGYAKLRGVGQWFPSDSLYRDIVGSSALDATADLRLNLSSRAGAWTFDAASSGIVGASGPAAVGFAERRPSTVRPDGRHQRVA